MLQSLQSPLVQGEESSVRQRAATFVLDGRWRSLIIFSFFALLFWFIEFLLQWYWLTKGDLGGSLVRSFAFTGTTLIGCSLFSSAIFKWWPRTAGHWRVRRHFGVSGFVFIFFHAISVYYFYFYFDLKRIYFSWNPFENPIVFGSLALPIFMIMALTSTDWAMQKLTPRVWKFIHRFVYIAYVSSIFHFVLINPSFLSNPPGYLLLGVTFLAVFGQIYWFFAIASKKRFRSWGALVGFGLIALTLILAYFAYRRLDMT